MVTMTNEAAGVEVLGVLETSTQGVLELLLSNKVVMYISDILWEPFEESLEEGKVFFNIKCNGKTIIEIERVDEQVN